MDFSIEQEQRFESIAFGPVQPVQMEAFESDDEARTFVDWCLNGSYTDRGIKRWWNRPRIVLDGFSPSESWGDEPEQVLRLAHWLVCAHSAT